MVFHSTLNSRSAKLSEKALWLFQRHLKKTVLKANGEGWQYPMLPSCAVNIYTIVHCFLLYYGVIMRLSSAIDDFFHSEMGLLICKYDPLWQYQCRVSVTQLTVKAHGPIIFKRGHVKYNCIITKLLKHALWNLMCRLGACTKK